MMELKDIKGVGPRALCLLNKLNIYTVEDLVTHYPFRYDILERGDLTKTEDGEHIIIDGKIESVPILMRFKAGLNKMNFRLVTPSGVVGVSIFNRAFLKNQLQVGVGVTVIGKFDKKKNVITASEIKAKCRNLANKEEGLGLVIIDYLQLVTSGGKRPESRQQEVSDISRAFKTMAMELKVPVIALAQLSRSAEKRENNQPMLADLRESGSIEQDADMVLFINRNDYYKAKEQLDQQKNVVADIIIAKHRKGSTGKFQLLFELNMSNFRNYLATDKEEENE